MKIKFKQLLKIDNIHGNLLKDKAFKGTKLEYAFKRFSEKNLVDLFRQFNSILEDLRIDNALTDSKTGAILYESDRSYQFSKEGKKNFLKQSRIEEDKWSEKEFDVEPFICKEIPKEIVFSENEIDILSGVIINPKSK